MPVEFCDVSWVNNCPSGYRRGHGVKCVYIDPLTRTSRTKRLEIAALNRETEVFEMFVTTFPMALLDFTVTRVGEFTGRFGPKDEQVSWNRWVMGSVQSIVLISKFML
ncbi:hypothetical protein J6590_014277 [Homalodisca vitripennis]|nr:hypothetical protein J6590_014277 [Homalodisca vitripennis]